MSNERGKKGFRKKRKIMRQEKEGNNEGTERKKERTNKVKWEKKERKIERKKERNEIQENEKTGSKKETF